MGGRLPPLNSLRAFEAAARHRSISGAAQELRVTHGAVSRHVAKLEEYLGAKLFAREHQRLALTARGKAYAARLSASFDQIREATTETFEAAASDAPLRIGIYPTLANNVLIPRLAQFKELFPDIGFEIITSHADLDPEDSEIDIAVRLGLGEWPGLVSELLFHEELLPVASPKLLCGRTLKDPRELAEFTLLHAAPRLHDWSHWLNFVGINDIDAQRGMRFEHSGLVYQAALNALGVAMAQTIHIQDDILQQRLVPLFNLPARTHRSYFLVYPASKSRDRRIVAFTTWMKSRTDSAYPLP